jgi:hypothetical protein
MTCDLASRPQTPFMADFRVGDEGRRLVAVF